MNEQIRKSAQVVAFFNAMAANSLQERPGKMKMIKLAYFADRL